MVSSLHCNRATRAWAYQYFAAICLPRVWRLAGTLELHLPALRSLLTVVVVQHGLTERDGGAVAQLAREVAELVATVALRAGLRPVKERVAGQEGRQLFHRPGRVAVVVRGVAVLQQVDTHERQWLLGRDHELRVGQRRGQHARQAGTHHVAAHKVARLRVYGQLAQRRAVKAQTAARAPKAGVGRHCAGRGRGGRGRGGGGRGGAEAYAEALVGPRVRALERQARRQHEHARTRRKTLVKRNCRENVSSSE
jgi:hypothetical protein